MLCREHSTTTEPYHPQIGHRFKSLQATHICSSCRQMFHICPKRCGNMMQQLQGMANGPCRKCTSLLVVTVMQVSVCPCVAFLLPVCPDEFFCRWRKQACSTSAASSGSSTSC